MLVSVHYSKQPPLLDFIGLLQQRKTITRQLSSGFWMDQQHLSGSLFCQSHCLCAEDEDGSACWALRLVGLLAGLHVLVGLLGGLPDWLGLLAVLCS